MNLIEVNGVSKQFKNQTALKETTISFEEGKIHGIVGMNGSGKTVFLKLLCGLLCPTAGAITVCGKVLGKDRDFAPDTGILIETPNFLPYKSDVLSESLLHLPLRMIFRHMHINLINIRSTYAS